MHQMISSGPNIDAELYQQLKRIAAAALQRGALTLRPTELVHEAWLRLVEANYTAVSAEHLRASLARALRFAMVDIWRSRQAQRRGGAIEIVSLDDLSSSQIPIIDDASHWLAVHEQLERIEQEEPALVALIECRCFGGMSIEEAAEALGISVPTVVRRWRFARAWFVTAFSGESTREPVAPGSAI